MRFDTSLSKHLVMMGHAGDLGVFGHKDDGGPLEASGEQVGSTDRLRERLKMSKYKKVQIRL